MKRKLIIAAAVAVAAVVTVVLFVVAHNPNPDFGYANEVFVLPTEVKIELEGDTHLVTADTLNIDVNGSIVSGSIALRSVDEREFARGPTRFSAEDPPEYGYIEKLVDGEWEFYGSLNSTFMIVTGTPKYTELNGRDHHFVLPLHDSGEYRVTERFREQFKTEDGGISRGDEVYSVSYRFTVPEPSGKKFDVCAVDTTGTVDGYMMRIALRANDGVVPYIDRSYVELEMYDGGWVDVPKSNAITLWIPSLSGTGYYRDEFWPYAYFRETEGSEDEPVAAVFSSGEFRPVDRDALHRITLRFTENKDGSGEEYFLTLKFRWG